MAEFDIDAHISNGKRLDWIVAPGKGQAPESVEAEVRQAAMKKFGSGVFFNHWDYVEACNGYLTVRMHA